MASRAGSLCSGDRETLRAAVTPDELQRAALLRKHVLGWPADDIAEALELTQSWSCR